MHSPKKSHMDAALRLFLYVKKEPGLGIFMSSPGGSTLNIFCDADWGACINSRKFITGCLVQYSSSLIFWRSKK